MDRTVERAPGAWSIRLAALAGAVFFVLIVSYANLVSGSPAATDSGDEIIEFVSGHQGRLQAAAVLMGLAMAAALIWVSGLFRVLRQAEGGKAALSVSALGGGVLAAAGSVTGALVLGTTAARIDDLGTDGARVFWTMFSLSVGATLLGLLVLIGASAIVFLQTRLFARWFGVASVVLALGSGVGAGTIGYPTTGIQVLAGIAIILDSVWIFLVSTFLWRNPNSALP